MLEREEPRALRNERIRDLSVWVREAAVETSQSGGAENRNGKRGHGRHSMRGAIGHGDDRHDGSAREDWREKEDDSVLSAARG